MLAAEKVRLAQEDLLAAQRAAGTLEDERVIAALEGLEAALRAQAQDTASAGQEQVPVSE